MSLWLFTIALQDGCLMMPRQSFPLMTDYEYEILIFFFDSRGCLSLAAVLYKPFSSLAFSAICA